MYIYSFILLLPFPHWINPDARRGMIPEIIAALLLSTCPRPASLRPRCRFPPRPRPEKVKRFTGSPVRIASAETLGGVPSAGQPRCSVSPGEREWTLSCHVHRGTSQAICHGKHVCVYVGGGEMREKCSHLNSYSDPLAQNSANTMVTVSGVIQEHARVPRSPSSGFCSI